jgi:hypothetical protein
MAISKELVESEFGLVRSGGREFAIGQRRLSTIPHPIHVHLLRSLRNAMVCVSCKALLRSLLLSPAHDSLPSLCDTDHLSTFVKSKTLVANLRTLASTHGALCSLQRQDTPPFKALAGRTTFYTSFFSDPVAPVPSVHLITLRSRAYTVLTNANVDVV